MKTIQIYKSDLSVIVIPDHLHATPRAWLFTKQVDSIPTPQKGQQLKWIPADPEDPQGEGELQVIDVPQPVPQTVTPLQFRLALIEAGISLSDIANFIDAVEDQVEKEKMKSIWEYASVIRRDNFLVNQIADEFGKTKEEVDELFREASNISL